MKVRTGEDSGVVGEHNGVVNSALRATRQAQPDCRAIDRSLKAPAGQDYFLWDLNKHIIYTLELSWFHGVRHLPSLYTVAISPAEILMKTPEQDCPASLA